MAVTLPGLASGLDTAAIISSLMDVAAIPKTLIESKITDRNLVISNLQTLNTSLQDLAAKAKTASGTEALRSFTTSSSSDAVTVVTSDGARAFSTSIVVDAVAQRHAVVTAAASDSSFAGTFTLVGSDGEQNEVTATSAEDLVKQINLAGAGVTATIVNGGVDADGNPLSRIQLTSEDTGEASAFSLHRGTAADVDAGTSADVASETGAAIITEGSDAMIRLYAGTAAEQTITSASNAFTAVAAGVDITVTRAGAEPVTVAVTADPVAQTKTAETFVKQVADLLTRIDNGSKATVADAGGTTTLGVFTGDSTVRALRTGLANAIQYPVDGISPSTVGISVDRYGKLTFDAEKFGAAMEEDPEGTQALFSAVAARVEEVTTQYSDKYDGLLTKRITGQESEVRTLETQVERWDLRLDKRRETLERTYAALETQMALMNSQMSWLTQQIDAFNASTDS
ncbi:flagellar filament capping protein FliD [Microbacterium oryzae]|uniref:flagellar filament capping protein FliD n=1 Tax=Microbacterium oryzae TaxID=743009 RepID=UPI0025B222D1|nr:flagellar filament capping protein FliD [Microbacterium oryzae]MDN3309664.1 flagellar filament capping protein FliD [Microbacterium oryzae]